MAFESLGDRLSRIFKKVRGQATLTEKNMDDMQYSYCEGRNRLKIIKCI